MSQIGALLDSMPDNELPKEKPPEARLKHGKWNVILAVVDMGVVSYLRFSEAGFGAGSCLKTRIRNVTGKRGGGGRGRKNDA
jgi:tRNA-splicing endonuclease subunit Sen54